MKYIQKGKVDIIEVVDEITIKNVDVFRIHMKRFLDEPSHQLIVDLEKVSYMNSSALGIIADAAMKAKKSKKELVIAGVKPPLEEIFEIVKFNSFLELFTSLQAAEEYCSQKFT